MLYALFPQVQLTDLATVGFLVVLESLLSADNALVMAVMVLGLPARAHRRALNYGLIGALTFRLLATALAVYLIHAAWPKLLGGLYLLYLVGTHFFRSHPDVPDGSRPPATPLLGLSPFWGTVVRVELVNLAFSVDSILVAVAMSTKFWVVLTGGLLGVVAMRFVVGRLVDLIRRYPTLIDGAFVIIGWVSIKLLIEYLHQMSWIGWEVPTSASLALVVLLLIGSYVIARRQDARRTDRPA